MNHDVKIVLPKLGESIVNATIVQWFKKVGDPVALDEPLLEVSTDKVNSEIPSSVAGVLKEIYAQPDELVEVGQVLALVGAQTDFSLLAPSSSPLPLSEKGEDREDLLSPSVLRSLKEKGIALSEIAQIAHTGEGGRLTKKDVENYAEQKKLRPCNVERVKMTAMRKAIAENMVKSFYEAPHASLITEVDVTEILQEIQTNKQDFLAKHQAKLTITAFAAQALCRALKKFPLLNASLEGDTIVMKRFVNLGIAVSVDQGVMVPVIKNCEEKTLAQIAVAISSLAEKTRHHRLVVDDMADGSITLTNFGMTGTLIGIPIIRYPEVAIVGLGAVTERAHVMQHRSIAIRSIMHVSLTFDHRVLDGIYGCNFLNELKRELETSRLHTETT